MSQELRNAYKQSPPSGAGGLSYAYYRLPYQDSYTIIESDNDPQILSSLEEIGDDAGFVISPFNQSSSCPVVLIRPDRIMTVALQSKQITATTSTSYTTSPSQEYSTAFDAYHSAVSNDTFHKLVLARKSILHLTPFNGKGLLAGVGSGLAGEGLLFLHACRLYPRLTIILFSTPQTGTWLIASPEILVEGQSGNYHTVALAGTMPYRDGYLDWSDKNKQEQHIVEKYIADTITPLASDILKDGPVTMRAGNLVHLRTDFRFHLKENTALGSLISRLHPTPAVCGLPKQEAREFILEHEGIDRRYYSGFAGPVNINNETHLYVSLRCAELHIDNPCCESARPFATLYAGGGIMPDSSCQSEWQETEQKMNTIKKVLELTN